MSHFPLDALWLSLSPRLQRFDRRLLQQLNDQMDLGYWQYSQTLDEPCCLTTALALLHDYIQQSDRPLHLLGHGISGCLALLYAQRYPQWVRSLTILSVGSNPALSWHSHYYALRRLLPCHRPMILAQIVRLLFGPQSYELTQAFIKILAADLDSALSPHSLAHQTPMTIASVPVPILAIVGRQDQILTPLGNAQLPWLKASDRLYLCPEGRHFCHYEYPQRIAQEIGEFWMAVEPTMTLIAA
ncbi:MAG: alpha/beta hydrolase [Spirulina sp. SIO3F2]|nr:alpha/beta hydrolase [Spirulina sp. SIO3F2]